MSLQPCEKVVPYNTHSNFLHLKKFALDNNDMNSDYQCWGPFALGDEKKGSIENNDKT